MHEYARSKYDLLFHTVQLSAGDTTHNSYLISKVKAITMHKLIEPESSKKSTEVLHAIRIEFLDQKI